MRGRREGPATGCIEVISEVDLSLEPLDHSHTRKGDEMGKNRFRWVARMYWVSGGFTTKGKKTVVLLSSYKGVEEDAFWDNEMTQTHPDEDEQQSDTGPRLHLLALDSVMTVLGDERRDQQK